MTIELNINQVENLLMMADHCKRHFNHEYAKSAVAILAAARKEYLKAYGEEQALILLEESAGK